MKRMGTKIAHKLKNTDSKPGNKGVLNEKWGVKDQRLEINDWGRD